MLGLNPDLITSRAYIRKVFRAMDRRGLRSMATITERIARSKMMSAEKVERIGRLSHGAIIEALARIRAKRKYFVWRNSAILSPADEILGKGASNIQPCYVYAARFQLTLIRL